MSSKPEHRHTTVRTEEEHEHGRSSQAQEAKGKGRGAPRQSEGEGGPQAGPSSTEDGRSEAPEVHQSDGHAARARWEHSQNSEQQQAAAGVSEQPQQQSSPAAAVDHSAKWGSGGGIPVSDSGGSGGAPRLLPPPTGRPPLPPAELLRAQLAFATAAASEVGRAGTLSTSYPSLEALAAAGGALEGVGTSGGGEQGVDTEEGDAVSHRKRKGQGYDAAEELSETEGEGGSGDSRRDHGGRGHKKPRLVWTAELHARFMNAVTHLGVKHAVPKTILQLMNVEGMTRENVASHLQKYRLYLKRLAGYPSAARLPLDTLQQVQQAIQQQGHPPLFQHNMAAIPPGAGMGFPGFMPPPPGAAAGGPQLQWGPAAGPPAGEVGPLAESSAPMAGNPWLSLQQVGAYGGAMAYPQMGSFGQPPGTIPGREGPPGLPYGWVWGLAPPGGGGMVPPPGHPSQLPPGEFTPSATPPESGPSGERGEALSGANPTGGGPHAATEGGPSERGNPGAAQPPKTVPDPPT